MLSIEIPMYFTVIPDRNLNPCLLTSIILIFPNAVASVSPSDASRPRRAIFFIITDYPKMISMSPRQEKSKKVPQKVNSIQWIRCSPHLNLLIDLISEHLFHSKRIFLFANLNRKLNLALRCWKITE